VRCYDAGFGRFTRVDPLASDMAEWSPYNYTFDNPVLYTDPDGRSPEICVPCIIKGGGSAAIDYFLQGAVNYIGGMSADDAFHYSNIDLIDVGVSGLQGTVNPLKIPGGKYGKAAASAVGDVAINLAKAKLNGEEYSLGQAGLDFIIGFTSSLGPDQVEEFFGKNSPKEAYNRRKHYGNTPKKSDRKALGAQTGEDVDHNTPLVKHYYEGDGKGGKPGYDMTDQQRKDFANDRSNMSVEPQSVNRSKGGKLSQYSKNQKKKHGL